MKSAVTRLAADSSVCDSQRVAAATAGRETSDCGRLKPFYWEMGRAGGRVASGSLGAANVSRRYPSTTMMAIASASK